jgi:hypothetical protein
MSEKKCWNDRFYTVAADSILVLADREGCEVFTVEGVIGPVSILAHDRKEAEFTYRQEIENDPRWCDLCESLNCFCDEVDQA